MVILFARPSHLWTHSTSLCNSTYPPISLTQLQEARQEYVNLMWSGQWTEGAAAAGHLTWPTGLCWSARETEADSDNESLMGTFLRGRITRGATEANGSHSCDYVSSQHTFSGAVIILAVFGQSLLCPHCCPHPHPLNRSVEFSLSKGWPRTQHQLSSY